MDSKKLLASKTIIRSHNFEASKYFYTSLLELRIVEAWNDPDLSRCILQIGGKRGTSFIEIQAIGKNNTLYDSAFDEHFVNDKMDLQILTNDVDYWANKLKGKISIRGPVDRPWGSKYSYLRDPDYLQVIIYQEK